MAVLGFKDRKYKRKAFAQHALIELPGQPAPRECLILDISDGGARLHVPPPALPDMFILRLSVNGNVRRVCMVAWRRGGETGVRFVKSTRDLVESETAAS